MPKSDTEHKQVKVRNHRTKELVLVDTKLAKILGILWNLGCQTTHSCQGNEDVPAYIKFADATSANRFAYLTAIPLHGNANLDAFAKLTGAAFGQLFFGEWSPSDKGPVLIARFTQEQRKAMDTQLKKVLHDAKSDEEL